ncbi:MAG: BACON domain-containing protein [Bacteroidales bacterium]|nr:BACON domain-containing protein [Bacteroidales bacterium]
MKKVLTLFCTAAAMLLWLAGCVEKPEEFPDDYVDLRYRVADSYNLDALSPKPFTIVVKSTKPWTIKSYHPVWCIIDIEEGEATADSLVRVGRGENTTVRVQYYDNTDLDDRTDVIEIASAGYIGKQVTVYQKGIAYLNVPEADLDEGMMFEKAGGELTLHVNSNQDWSAKVIEGDWLKVSAGATGKLDGEIKVSAGENSGEKRYATVAIYDRHGEERAIVKFTQDGVQLDPATFEIRAGYDQLSVELNVVSNAKWVAEKGGETDWFTIDNPDGHEGTDVLRLTLQDNSAGTSLRKSSIIIKTIASNPGDAVAEKEIILKQAYPITPVRHIMDNDEIGNWESDWANPPAYTKDVGTLFTAKCRLHNGSMPFGNYTFRWKDYVADPAAAEAIRVRHWFCYGESCEMKFDIRPAEGKISFDFNVAGDGNKPSISAYTACDFTQPIEITYKFDPSGAEHCHVTYLVNGVEAASFDTSESMLRTVTWGTKVNMYLGVDKSGSAVMEWYEYTPPMNWED